MQRVYTIFSEVLKLIPRYHFDKAVETHGAERYVKTFSTWSHFIAMLYSQITGKDSLRDIETGLQAPSSRWYHLGFSGVRRSTLADANARRDYRVFEDTFYKLLDRCRDLTPKHRFRFNRDIRNTSKLCRQTNTSTTEKYARGVDLEMMRKTQALIQIPTDLIPKNDCP